MPKTSQILASRGSFIIESDQVLDVPTELQDELGNILIPTEVELEGLAKVLSKNADGTFTCWNYTGEQRAILWRAWHDTIEVDDPAHQVTEKPYESATPAPDPYTNLGCLEGPPGPPGPEGPPGPPGPAPDDGDIQAVCMSLCA